MNSEKGEFLFLRKIIQNHTPEIRGGDGKLMPGSVAEIERVRIGDTDQFIMTRGRCRENPVLLFLHGGPGFSHMPFARKYQIGLEESFTVVNWDQRGAGLSYSNKISEDSMNVEQFISDARELTGVLLKKFNKEKIYLAGHSWGSYLGILTAARYPELFHAYVGVSQVVDVITAGRSEYMHILDLAEKEGNQKAVGELKRIGLPLYEDIKKFRIMRKWFDHYEGDRELDLTKIALRGILSGPEYKIVDIIKYINGLNFSQANITEEVYGNLSETLTEIRIPAYFCSGAHDYGTPPELVSSYMENLAAPVKRMYLFEKSAHCPHLQEPERFCDIMNSIKQEIPCTQNDTI